MAVQQQVNTFTGGMDLDTDIHLIGSDKYRYAENIRITTDKNNAKGALQSISPIYKCSSKFENGGGYLLNVIPAYSKILGTTDGVIFNKETNKLDDCAIIFTFNERYKINGLYAVTVNDPTDSKTIIIFEGKLDIFTQVSLINNYESESINNVYISDGISSLKVINISKQNQSIENSKQFDIDGTSTLYAPRLDTFIQGSLTSGCVQYCYQLFNDGGTKTQMSIISGRIILSKSGVLSKYNLNGAKPKTMLNRGCKMQIKFYNVSNFKNIRYYRIQYEDNTSIPKIYIIGESELPEESYSGIQTIYFTDNGNVYSEITIDELNKAYNSGVISQTICKKDNRLFAANVKYHQWQVDYDARAYRCDINRKVTLNSLTGQPITCDIDDILSGNIEIPIKHDCINPFNSSNSNLPEVQYKNQCMFNKNTDYLGGSGINVDYKFIVCQFEEDHFSQRSERYSKLDLDYTGFAGRELINAAYVKYKSVDASAGDYHVTIENGKNYNNDYLSYKFTSYQRDEVYRFGIVFYNDKGIKSPVYWIGDIKFPNGAISPAFSSNDNQVCSYPIGIEFNVKNVPNGAVSYEIVRCDRTLADRTVMANVAISSTVKFNMWKSDDSSTDTANANGEYDRRPLTIPNFSKNTTIVSWRTANPEGTFAKTIDKGDNNTTYDLMYMISPEISFNKESCDTLFKNCFLSIYGFLDTGIYTTPLINGSRYQIMAAPIKATVENCCVDYQNLKTNFFGQVYLEKNSNSGYNTYLIDGPSTSDNRDYISGGVVKYYDFSPSKSLDICNIDDIKYVGSLENNISPTENEDAFIIYKNQYVVFNKYLYTNTSVGGWPSIGVNGAVCIFTSQKLTNVIAPALDHDTPGVLLANIKRNISQYGGDTYSARNNSVYISIGADSINTEYSLGQICVFGGDTYLNIHDYSNTMLFSYNDPYRDSNIKRYVQCYIPFESSINTYLRFDKHFSQCVVGTEKQKASISFRGTAGTLYKGVQETDMYMYNSAYSEVGNGKKHVSNSYRDSFSPLHLNRIIVSNPKTPGEINDSWTSFEYANYLDVDTKYGQITNLIVFKDKLYFFQENAVGMASVNDRMLITTNDSSDLTLGTGGVLSRYDYIITSNGSDIINDKSITQSNSSVYWYDKNKNIICKFNDSGFIELSKAKNIQSIFNNDLVNKQDNHLSFYDNKYNELWFVVNDKSIIYNENIDSFTSFYNFAPQYAISLQNELIVTKDSYLYYMYNDQVGCQSIKPNAKIEIVVNQNPQTTKVFDSVWFNGNIYDNDTESLKNISSISFKTKYQESDIINGSDIEQREDTYKFAIPRQKTTNKSDLYQPRMRGKYLVCDYTFDYKPDSNFNITNIITTYRYSMI